MVAGGRIDRDLQGAKVTTTSLCMGSRKEGFTVGKKLAAKFTLSVYWNSSYVNPSDRRDPSRV